MYNIDDFIGKIATLKLVNGIELVCQVLAHDNENKILNIGNPRVVVINGEELALIPYSFTGLAEEVCIPMSSVQTILETYKESADDYEKLVNPSTTADK